MQVEALEREAEECTAAVARKEEELVDLLQERARDRAALADKDMASQEQAGHPLPPPRAHSLRSPMPACNTFPCSFCLSTCVLKSMYCLKRYGCQHALTQHVVECA